MRLRIIITAMLIVWVNNLFAQTIRFNKVNQSGLLVNYDSKGLYINDSVFVSIQNTLNTTITQAGFTFSKFDKNGNEIFSKSYVFDTSIITGPVTVFMSSDSFIYGIAQTYYQHVSDPQLYIIKFRLNGDTVWLKRTGKPLAIEGFRELIETNDKKIVGVGISAIAADGWAKNHVSLMKIDTNGTVLWQKDYGPNGKHSYGWGVVETPTHGFLISGYKSDGGNAGFPFNEEDDVYAIKTDSAGNTIWSKYFGTLHHEDAGLGVIKCKAGGYYLIGQTDTSDAITFYFSRLIQIIKIDENGNLVWKKKYGDYSYDNANRNGFELADGSVVTYGGYQDTTINQVSHAQILKVDSNGVQKWHRYYTYTGADINPWALTHSPDGGFLMSGFVNYNIVQPADGWLLKVDSVGCLVGGCELWDEVEEVQWANNNEQLTLYPNPANEWLIVNGEWLIGNTIQIYDLLGRLQNQPINKSSTQQIQIDVSKLSSGVYFLKVTDGKGNVKMGKFVKE